MFKKVRLTITALVCATAAFAQSGAIKVHMFDKTTKQPIPFANIIVEKAGTQVGGGVTDIDGYCTIKPLDPGEYDVKAVYEGYQQLELAGISVGPDKTAYRDLPMETSAQQLTVVHVVKDKVPLVSPNTQTGQTITKEDYQRMAVKDVNSVAAQSAGVYQKDIGGDLNVRGGRSDATQYIIDGMKVTADQAVSGIPQSMVDQITTITGGIPAKYGDATGGIVEINTLGASPKFFGSVQGISSQFLDAFGYNDVNFSVGGPIYSKRSKDTNNKAKIPVIDFILGGEYSYKKDASPSFVGGYQVKSDTLAAIQQRPFIINPAGGYQRSAEYITADQITHTKYRPNIPASTMSVNGKLGFHVTDNVSITAGGSYEYDKSRDFIYVYELYNSDQNPTSTTNAWRAFVRLTQRFPTPEGKDKNAIIKNAYYTVQGEYGNSYFLTQNQYLKGDLFSYGYVGKFQQYFSNVYALGNGNQGIAYYQAGYADSLYTFTPGDKNPLEANYTSQLYSLLGAQNVTNPNLIQENEGLLNGGRPSNVYSMWYNTGRAYGGESMQNSNHLRFTANFSADIKDHAVQVGFEYEQNSISYWSLTAVDLWNVMRQNSNLQLQQLDINNPILVAKGTYNTYAYNRLYTPGLQSQFDKSMRQKLGLPVDGTDYIQPDNYDPSFFSLDMFSASDLINNGSSIVSYYGYDYLGNKSSSTPSIDDYFNAKDANGNRTYPIAPYRPVYMAGYIQDHFDIKNLKFDVGVRVDRFDANQPVLKDPYLLFPAKTVAEIPSSDLPAGEKNNVPSNMGSNYIVYVNDAQNPTTIVGYRNGNTWYNASGNVIPDPSVLASATTSGNIQPYLENPSQTKVSSNAFTTYTPQVNVMPRIAFAFPISDMANFFAHYDILTQRPPGVGYNIFNPISYEFIQSNIGGVLSNPNLLPQQTTDYELGFTQVLNEAKSAALTFSAFYREMRNLVQIYRYLDAYPVTYMAYSNLDFATVKGLSVSYDLRRVNNIKLRASYTLQFANGTGSGPSSGYNLANSGQPNLQVPQPLDYDQRHTFLINVDYHYASGENYNGPVWKTKGGKEIQILANAGLNVNLSAGSGTPYTKQGNATEGDPNSQNVGIGIAQHYSLVGSINGAYLPWQYRVDLRADKDFPITLMKSKGDKAKHCDLLVYVQVLNLLNTENILNVYHFTGSPTDDGYLSSLEGQQYIAAQTSAKAFQDQYKIKEQDPSYFAMPRQIRLGVEFNF